MPGAHLLRSLRAKSRSARPADASRLRSTRAGLIIGVAVLLAACDGGPPVVGNKQDDVGPFPAADRPVAQIISPRWSTEEARDRLNEAGEVMNKAGIAKGMTVADIGAGEGYYTVRLSPMVGARGRVLAEDIVPETIRALAQRVQRERLDNVAIKLGQPNDPQLPAVSFDRIFMIHMYHEIARPSEFLWHLRDALKPNGSIVIVDGDRPTNRHGTPPRLLVCELNAVGYDLKRFERLPDSESYFAWFEARGPKPAPQDIPVCGP